MAFPAIVALGGNVGDVRVHFQSAIDALVRLPGMSLACVSPLYVTAPVDASGPHFLNAAIMLETTWAPLELLHTLQDLECLHGRERPYLHAPRTLDLDLIVQGDSHRRSAELTLPHPRWRERAFVMRPVLDMCAAMPALATWLALGPHDAERLADAAGIAEHPSGWDTDWKATLASAVFAPHRRPLRKTPPAA